MLKHSITTTTRFLSLVLSLFFCASGYNVKAQLNRKVLFIGNSYTSVNNLPQLVHDVALSAGDTLIFDSHSPGGYQLVDHNLNTITQNKIMAGGWQYVVLQGQSQEPIVATSQFNNGAGALFSLIKQYNPCAVTMPYMTWGRKNGDAFSCPFFPVMCTYLGMDTTLRNQYLSLTSSLNGEVSPVSVVWSYIRQHFPSIELYDPDESHPSAAGSYAAACCFYSAIFKKDPTLITFNFGLNTTDAANIKMAAKTMVYDNLQEWDFKKLPDANISFQIGTGTNEVIFIAPSSGIMQTYLWDFGDGTNSTMSYVPHSYAADGTYTVSLTTTTCDLQGLHTSFTDTVIQFCSHTPTVYSLHPWLCLQDTLWTQPADTYQWFLYGDSIPETNQSLTDYHQYGNSGFSVVATTNGCSELSTLFSESPQWSGYYFDALGDPCIGDTVMFHVLHINGFLSGQENIFWYKNDTLLSSMTNEDTLLIISSGKYECKVVDPNSNCPADTTSYSIEYNCAVNAISEVDQKSFGLIYPNPATEYIIIKLAAYTMQETFQIYNATGMLMKKILAAGAETTINISDLPDGIYFVRLKNGISRALKFIKT